MFGARVVKTAVAVAASILIAKSLHLYAYQFAGIIAVLSVQPSLYRSLRNGVQQIVSAMMGAVLGAAALFTLGDSFLAMGFTAFLLMALHVYMKWTNSLLVSVVIAINTMGTVGLGFWAAAYNQVTLVLIGTIIGTLINLLHKPVHQERAEEILRQAEGMLRTLLHYILLDLERGKMTPYTSMKSQFDEIRAYIRKGKEISGLINEDKKFRKRRTKNTFTIFQSFETMLERIHDMAKVLDQADLAAGAELTFAQKTLRIVIAMQENVIKGKRLNLRLLQLVLDKRRNQLWTDSTDSEGFYNVYGHVREYLLELERFTVEHTGRLKRYLSYSSIDRPGLIAEVSRILEQYNLNITDVSIRVNGEFATTTIEVSSGAEFDGDKLVREVANINHVLSAECK